MTLFLCLLTTMPSYGLELKNSELKTVKYTDLLSADEGYFSVSTLGTTAFCRPLYRITKSGSGELTIESPQKQELEADVHTEAALAFLAHSVDKGIAEGPLESFIENSISGGDFQSSRIGYVQRIGDAYYALYSKEVRAGSPQILLVKFSLLSDNADSDEEKGALIELLDGTKVLVEVSDTDAAPKGFSIRDMEGFKMTHEIVRLVTGGNADKALEVLFTSAGFQDQNLGPLADVCNGLLDSYEKEDTDKNAVKTFLRKVIAYEVEFSDDVETAQNVQLIAGQALTIISWMERDTLVHLRSARVTADNNDMISNDERGKSFISRKSLLPEVEETAGEGTIGFYWRGIETILSKLHEKKNVSKAINVVKRAIFGEAGFDRAKDKVVMYLMDHGFINPNMGLKKVTRLKRISTIHETFFLSDHLPHSNQTTSTGSGHFQGTSLDVKHSTGGRGIQLSVRYNADAEIEDIIAQEWDGTEEGRKEGKDWTLALPGYVDYFINIEESRFNDFSINLSESEAALFNHGFDFSRENLIKVSEAVSDRSRKAPFTAVKVGDKIVLVGEAPVPIRWMRLGKLAEERDLVSLYEGLTGQKFDEFISSLAVGYKDSDFSDESPFELAGEDKVPQAVRQNVPSFGRSKAVFQYVGENSDFIKKALVAQAQSDKLIRIPVEIINDENKGFIEALQAEGTHGYVELFFTDSPLMVDPSDYDLNLRPIPEHLKEANRNRTNTITVFPVTKGEELPDSKANQRWTSLGGASVEDTIISPVGRSFDRSGIVRGVLFGLLLSEIAKDPSNREFTLETFEGYRSFCESQGIESPELSMEDFLDLATGSFSRIVKALNRVIGSLPNMPLNTTEAAEVYKFAEALIRA
ncbi:MAG: hypothetical protein HQ594_04840 [Candidatus Omnitrophica bacterium]|nr:hypothetical protein [Candidatus Omnitrophota bacterium]